VKNFLKNLPEKELENGLIFEIGTHGWTNGYLKKQLKDFYELYKNRVVRDNVGGMRASHMFACWVVMKTLRPEYVIESGVWNGGGTWLIEKTLPGVKIICLDPNLKKERYVSKNAVYLKKDFGLINWDKLPKDKTLIIFDDHQNALRRVREAKKFGFKNIIFEDNGAPMFDKGGSMGDFYSIKKVFSGLGFDPDCSLKIKISKILWMLYYTKNLNLLKKTIREFRAVPKNFSDREYLLDNLDAYYEFPPIFKRAFAEDIKKWFRKDSLLNDSQGGEWMDFYNERDSYLGICYLKLKN